MALAQVGRKKIATEYEACSLWEREPWIDDSIKSFYERTYNLMICFAVIATAHPHWAALMSLDKKSSAKDDSFQK